ncbi:MAG: hypothetical protein ACRDPE_22665 [Solirubrobacterales bacterium]
MGSTLLSVWSHWWRLVEWGWSAAAKLLTENGDGPALTALGLVYSDQGSAVNDQAWLRGTVARVVNNLALCAGGLKTIAEAVEFMEGRQDLPPLLYDADGQSVLADGDEVRLVAEQGANVKLRALAFRDAKPEDDGSDDDEASPYDRFIGLQNKRRRLWWIWRLSSSVFMAHHLYLRNPGWWWQEYETLRGLFGEERFAARLREQLGFDCEAAIAISDAVPSLVRDRMMSRMESARDDPEEFRTGNPAFDWAESVFDDKWKSDPTNAARFIPIVWALNTLGEACLLSPTEVAAATGVSGEVGAAYLERMSLPFSQGEGDWFALAEEVRWHPYVKVTDEAYLLTSPGADLWALRPAFEGALKDGAGYSKHRGRWLERRAVETLGPVLIPDETHLSVRFHDGERQGEIDVLMRFGSTAVVVEAKSATLRPGARRGGEALVSNLRENLTKAAKQGERVKEVLLGSEPLTGLSGEEVKLAERVTEVQTIVVTLDDLSAVAPVLWELEGTRTMPEGVTAPWVVPPRRDRRASRSPPRTFRSSRPK